MRLRLGEQASEWIPKGVFFFSTRKTDRIRISVQNTKVLMQ